MRRAVGDVLAAEEDAAVGRAARSRRSCAASSSCRSPTGRAARRSGRARSRGPGPRSPWSVAEALGDPLEADVRLAVAHRREPIAFRQSAHGHPTDRPIGSPPHGDHGGWSPPSRPARSASCRASSSASPRRRPATRSPRSLGYVVAIGGIGLQAPAVLLLAFVPMAADRLGLLLHEPRRPGLRHDLLRGSRRRWARTRAGSAAGRSSSPTSSSWPTSRRSPGKYSFLLFGWQSAADSTLGGHRRRRGLDRDHDRDLRDRHRAVARARRSACSAPRSSRSPLFAVVALVKVAGGDAEVGAPDVSLGWLNPFAIDELRRAHRRAAAVRVHLLGLGLDGDASTRSPRTPNEGPGKAAVVATVILLAIYVIVAFAAQAYAEPEDADRTNADDVLVGAGQGRVRRRRWTRSSSSRC